MDQIFSDMLPEAIRERFGNVWVEAGAIVVLSFITALLVAWLLSAWVGRLTRRTSTDLDDAILDRLRRPLFLTILFYGLGTNAALVADFESGLMRSALFDWGAGLRNRARLRLEQIEANHRQDDPEIGEELLHVSLVCFR